jgi:anti-anti-sigma factor
MSITAIQPHDDALVITINKRTLDDRATEKLVDDIYTAAAARTGVPIVLDMGRVKFAPSVALGALVKLVKSFEFEGRRLALIGVDHRVRDAVRITSLDQILEIHPDLDAVLSAK